MSWIRVFAGTFAAAFNTGTATAGIYADFGPSLISSIEGAYASSSTFAGVSAISPQAEIHTDFYTKWGTFDIDDLSPGFALADEEVFVIREPSGDENVLIVARLKDHSAPTVQAYWYPSVDKSNLPGDGDRLETGSAISVGGRSGSRARDSCTAALRVMPEKESRTPGSGAVRAVKP